MGSPMALNKEAEGALAILRELGEVDYNSTVASFRSYGSDKSVLVGGYGSESKTVMGLYRDIMEELWRLVQGIEGR